MIAWTEGYSPFIMGGSCHHPVGVEVEPGEKYEIGGGYYGHLIANPNTGDTFVVEFTTGAFIGPDLETVRDDISQCDDPAMMQGQLDKATERRSKVHVETPETFWSRFRKRETA